MTIIIDYVRHGATRRYVIDHLRVWDFCEKVNRLTANCPTEELNLLRNRYPVLTYTDVDHEFVDGDELLGQRLAEAIARFRELAASLEVLQ